MERVVANEEFENEIEVQKSLRPKSFREYIGQESLKDKMSIYIEAAKKKRKFCRPYTIIWPSWTWKNYSSWGYCQ